MSLVNDMLNDLDARRSKQPASSVNLEWLTAEKKPLKSNSGIIKSTAGIVALAAIVFIGWQYYTSDKILTVNDMFLEKTASTENIVARNTILSDITFSTTAQSIVVQLHTSAAPTYKITAGQQNVTIELAGVVVQLHNPLIDARHPVSAVVINELEGVTEVVLTIEGTFTHTVSGTPDKEAGLAVTITPEISPPVLSAKNNQRNRVRPVKKTADANRQIQAENADAADKRNNLMASDFTNKNGQKNTAVTKSLGKQNTLNSTDKRDMLIERPVTHNSAHRTDLVLANKTASLASSQHTDSVKTALPLTKRQKDQQASHKATQLIAQKRYAAAETLLNNIVQQDPAAIRSAQTLIALLLSQNRPAQAQTVLNQLPAGKADAPQFVAMQARVYLLQDNAERAVTLLMHNAPPVHTHQHYHQLLAQAAQRAKQFTLAEQTYRSLMATDSTRGDWWVGLAISLDAQGFAANAKAAYQKALNSGQINQALRRYAQQRLSAY